MPLVVVDDKIELDSIENDKENLCEKEFEGNSDNVTITQSEQILNKRNESGREGRKTEMYYKRIVGSFESY